MLGKRSKTLIVASNPIAQKTATATKSGFEMAAANRDCQVTAG
jgi:hypothetical protein